MSVAKMREALADSLARDQFSHLALNHYHGQEPNLKKIIIRKIVIKRVDNLSFTYRYQTRDIVKNYPIDTAIKMIGDFLAGEWDHAILYTLENNFIFQRQGRTIHFNKIAPSVTEKPADTHDKQKQRLITTEDASYLTELKLTDKSGKIYQNAQDKYRQINKFIEIIAGLLRDTKLQEKDKPIQVADMGSGKGYLTFALYDYLSKNLQQKPVITGVEYRQDMVDLCNGIAQKVGFDTLHFVQNTIANYPMKAIDILIALHACDTATDEAIAGGIAANASLIVCSPCCHKQIRREMERNKPVNDMAFLTRFGTFLERHAEMVTDGLRALILEYHGYETNMFEFISDAHTPKNIMITAIKTSVTPERQKEILEEINHLKKEFGITKHHLETLAKI